jgi:hypothetical protein
MKPGGRGRTRLVDVRRPIWADVGTDHPAAARAYHAWEIRTEKFFRQLDQARPTAINPNAIDTTAAITSIIHMGFLPV